MRSPRLLSLVFLTFLSHILATRCDRCAHCYQLRCLGQNHGSDPASTRGRSRVRRNEMIFIFNVLLNIIFLCDTYLLRLLRPLHFVLGRLLQRLHVRVGGGDFVPCLIVRFHVIVASIGHPNLPHHTMSPHEPLQTAGTRPAEFIIFNTQFIILNTECIILNAEFIISNTQFIVCNPEFIICNTVCVSRPIACCKVVWLRP